MTFFIIADIGEHVDLSRHTEQHRQLDVAKRVGVGVDQAGQQGAARSVHHPRVLRHRAAEIGIDDDALSRTLGLPNFRFRAKRIFHRAQDVALDIADGSDVRVGAVGVDPHTGASREAVVGNDGWAAVNV